MHTQVEKKCDKNQDKMIDRRRRITVDAVQVKKIAPRNQNGLDNDWQGCEKNFIRIRAQLSNYVEASSLDKIMLYPWFCSFLLFHIESSAEVSIVALQSGAMHVKKAMLNEINLNAIEDTDSGFTSIPHALLIGKQGTSIIAIRTVGSYTMDNLRDTSIKVVPKGWDLKLKGNRYTFNTPEGPDTIVSVS